VLINKRLFIREKLNFTIMINVRIFSHNVRILILQNKFVHRERILTLKLYQSKFKYARIK